MELTKAQIKALADGDREAFLSLYQHFFVALSLFARGFNVGHDEAEDIVQEVFCRLYDDRCLFENVASLKAYLYGAVRNGCLNHIRDEHRRKNRESHFMAVLEDNRTFFDDIVESEVYRQLHQLLDELPHQCRVIFEQTLQGATSEEIARAMDLSVETVKTQRKKAKRLLRERYTTLYQIFGILF